MSLSTNFVSQFDSLNLVFKDFSNCVGLSLVDELSLAQPCRELTKELSES